MGIEKNRDGKNFKSNNKIPRTVRLWMRRKNLASKALLRVKTLKGCSNLKDKIREAEREITKENFKRKLDLENKAIAEMNRNPKHFFKYVKILTKNKGKIGPFTDSKGKVIDKDPATILQDQYM